jgi:hypothetical protein
LGDAEIALQLVSITEGLNVANDDGVNLFDKPGDTYTIGQGDEFAFLPTFWVDQSAPKQKYSATFKLLDVSNGNRFAESGTFNLDFEPVPEPSFVLGLGLMGLLGLMRKSSANLDSNSDT